SAKSLKNMPAKTGEWTARKCFPTCTFPPSIINTMLSTPTPGEEKSNSRGFFIPLTFFTVNLASTKMRSSLMNPCASN
ncbi:hypothetical protein PFISCL1PPCAC_20931, partial [Pristionchus fissidentatus]